MVSDMERIGDQAADIADLSLYVAKNITAIPETITQMAEDTVRMVTESVDAFRVIWSCVEMSLTEMMWWTMRLTRSKRSLQI